MKETKNLSVTDISKLTGVSCPTIYKVLKENLGYVSNRLIKLESESQKLRVDLPLKNAGSSQDRNKN